MLNGVTLQQQKKLTPFIDQFVEPDALLHMTTMRIVSSNKRES